MDEFVVFLTVGLLMIAAMLIAFTGGLGIMDIAGNSGNYGKYYYDSRIHYTTTSTIKTTEKGKEFLVGPENVQTWRSIGPNKINASYLSGNSGYTVPDKYLFNGLLFGGNSLEISTDVDTSNVKGAYIKFDIDKTNGYGNLIIKINGNVITDKVLAIGTHTFIINGSMLSANNIIEAYPSSSFWRIWAPDVYYLKNFEFTIQSQYSKPSQIKFNVYGEEAGRLSYDKGRVLLDLQDHKGILKMNLNGNEIFSNQTSGYQAVYFDQKNLRYGENVLDLYAVENSAFEGTASIIFYYYTTRQNEFSIDFDVPQWRYNTLNSSYGSMRFNVTKIMSSGGISVSIENSKGVKTAQYYDTLKTKGYILLFNATQTSLGKNIVRIKPLDNSTFYVSNMSIEV